MEMARLGAGLGMRLLAWTRRATRDRERYGLKLVALETLFSESDVVTLHLSYTPETAGLVSRALLERLKPGAWFVNTARARIVDNMALLDLLNAGRLAGAAFDVFEEEPVRGRHPLLELPNVLATPHIGYNTTEAASSMLRISIATLEAWTRGERLHVVN
jgi:D-3-phosphoglycerate dehydrogenase